MIGKSGLSLSTIRLSCVRLAIGILLLAAGLLRAQSAVPVMDASQLWEPKPLDSTWLVTAGDDPNYARPDFDDSAWKRFDPNHSIVGVLGDSKPKVIWYRMHLKVNPNQTGLGLSELQISRAFEVYINGERVMAEGSFTPFVPYTMTAYVLTPIPQRMVATGKLLVAVRAHITKPEWGQGQNPGYYGDNLRIGPLGTLQRENSLAILGGYSLEWADNFFQIAVGLVALVLWVAQRKQMPYLWIAAVGGMVALETPEPLIAAFYNIPAYWELLSDLIRLVSPFLWASLYFSFLNVRVTSRWRVYLVIAGALNALTAMQRMLFPNPLPIQVLINLPYIVLLAVIIPGMLAVHWRRGNREAGILLIPAILFSLLLYADIVLSFMFRVPSWREETLRIASLLDNFSVGPIKLPLGFISSILCTIALAIIILLRSSTMSRRQAQLESELEAAQQVQQVLVSENPKAIPGFAVECVYLPAQQVGGDFFQILPDGGGGLLVVVGDVAGKGLSAAMLVSVLVGALRATAEYTRNPAELLAKLNERLVGRGGGGFSTALAVHIAEDGTVAAANAGHLSPYLDGREIELPGALPLGVVGGTEYSLTRFVVPPGSRLTFYSDGVVEAQNSEGELFGFERSEALATRPAAEIAEEATRFGQRDDITVVSVERVGVPVAA